VINTPVTNDVATPTLIVRRPENASGYRKLAWRTAHQALQRAEESGWRLGRFVWAYDAGRVDIAHAVPGEDLKLLFHFPVGNDAYAALVSKPGLSAVVGIDRAAGPLSVRQISPSQLTAIGD
jgi:hypothetical protein